MQPGLVHGVYSVNRLTESKPCSKLSVNHSYKASSYTDQRRREESRLGVLFSKKSSISTVLNLENGKDAFYSGLVQGGTQRVFFFKQIWILERNFFKQQLDTALSKSVVVSVLLLLLL